MNAAASSLLFVCAGNSCRSVMAEAFAKQQLRDWVVKSAGLHPLPEYDSKAAIATLKDHFGIVVSDHRQTNVRDLDLDSFDVLIAMDKGIEAALRKFTTRDVVAWNISDPWQGDPAEYRECALEILRSLSELVQRVRAERPLEM